MELYIQKRTYTSIESSTVEVIGPIISTVPASHNDLKEKFVQKKNVRIVQKEMTICSDFNIGMVLPILSFPLFFSYESARDDNFVTLQKFLWILNDLEQYLVSLRWWGNMKQSLIFVAVCAKKEKLKEMSKEQ